MAASFGVFSKANFAGVDQGVDFSGSGVIPAPDPLRVTSVRSVSIIEGGSYPLVGFQFTGGPYKGRYGYVMENFVPSVKQGQVLKAGQPLGVAAGKYPYIEIGFASGPDGSPVAPLYPDPHSPKPAGQAMWSYLQGKIGGSTPVTAPSPSAFGSVPGQSSTGGGGGGFWSVVKGVLTWNPLPSPLGGQPVAQAGASAAGAVSSVVDALKFIFSIRFLEVVGGGIMVLLGLYLLARQVGLAQDPPGPLPGSQASRQLSDQAASELQVSPGRASYSGPRTRRRSVDVSERGAQRRAVRRRSEAASPSNEIPF